MRTPIPLINRIIGSHGVSMYSAFYRYVDELRDEIKNRQLLFKCNHPIYNILIERGEYSGFTVKSEIRKTLIRDVQIKEEDIQSIRPDCLIWSHDEALCYWNKVYFRDIIQSRLCEYRLPSTQTLRTSFGSIKCP